MSPLGALAERVRERREDETGALSAALPIIAISLLVLAGLGIDGSRQLNTRAQAVAFAEEAARSGALAIYPGEQVLRLNETEVKQRVATYCAAILKLDQVTSCEYLGLSTDRDQDGNPFPNPLIVTVRVETQIKPTLLGIVYNKPLTATGVGRGRPIEGLDDRTQ